MCVCVCVRVCVCVVCVGGAVDDGNCSPWVTCNSSVVQESIRWPLVAIGQKAKDRIRDSDINSQYV